MAAETLAEFLKRTIREAGASVHSIARASGVPQPVLHRFLKGERDITLSTAQKLLANFGLQLRPKGNTK